MHTFLTNNKGIDVTYNQLNLPTVDYYPFGMQIPGLCSDSNSDNYTIEGNELQDAQNLQWVNFGYRHYDVQLSRWNVTDPANQYHSPYVYCGNNPINRIDPDGAADMYLWLRNMVKFIKEKRKMDAEAAWLARHYTGGFSGFWITTFDLGEKLVTEVTFSDVAQAEAEMLAANKEAEEVHETDKEVHPFAAYGTDGEKLLLFLLADVLLLLETPIDELGEGIKFDLGELDPKNVTDQGLLNGYINLVALGGNELLEVASEFFGLDWSDEDIKFNSNLIQGALHQANGDLLIKALSTSTLTNMPSTDAIKEVAMIYGFSKKALGPLFMTAKCFDMLKSLNGAFTNRSPMMEPLIETINYIDEYGSYKWDNDFRNTYQRKLFERNEWNFIFGED